MLDWMLERMNFCAVGIPCLEIVLLSSLCGENVHTDDDGFNGDRESMN